MRNDFPSPRGRVTKKRRARRILPIAALSVTAVLTAGCVATNQSAPVAAAQRDALNRLAAAQVADLALSRTLMAALLDIQSAALRNQLARATITRYITMSGEVNLVRLDADIAAAPSADDVAYTLAADVRAGALTRDAAVGILHQIADALRAPGATGAADLRNALSSLSPLRAKAQADETLLAMMDTRSGAIARLLAEVGADAAALDALTNLSPDAGATLRELAAQLWRTAIVERVDDPTKRAAAQRVLDSVLGAKANSITSSSPAS